MHYINNPNSPAKTYQDVMNIAIGNGVDPKRVYIYLASLGVRGELARVFNGDQYDDPIKMAITGKNTLVNEVEVCATCGGLVFNGGRKQQADNTTETKKSAKAVASGSPVFDGWLLLAGDSYASVQDAFELSGLSKSMSLDEFAPLFKQHYKENNKGRFVKD